MTLRFTAGGNDFAQEITVLGTGDLNIHNITGGARTVHKDQRINIRGISVAAAEPAALRLIVAFDEDGDGFPDEAVRKALHDFNLQGEDVLRPLLGDLLFGMR